MLDDDDIWLPKKLEIQISQMIEKNAKFSSTRVCLVMVFINQIMNISYITKNIFKILKKKYKKTNYLKNGKFLVLEF